MESTLTPQAEILSPPNNASFGPTAEERFAPEPGWDDPDHQQLDNPSESDGTPLEDGATEELDAEGNPVAKAPEFQPITLDFHGIPVEIKSMQDLVAREEAFQRSRSMQADYTRKTQALAQERNQLSEIRRIVEENDDVRKYIMFRSQGYRPDQIMGMMTQQEQVPEQYVIHPETGQVVANPDYIVYQMQKNAQPTPTQQDPRLQQQLQQQQAAISQATMQSGVQARGMIGQNFGYDFSRPLSSQGQIYMPEDVVDAMTDELQRMGVDPRGVPPPEAITNAFARLFPDVVEHRRRTEEARQKAARMPRPGVTPPARANSTWLPQNGSRRSGAVGGTPDEFI